MTEKLAGVGQLDGAVDRGVGLDLADVVQQGAADRDVAVQGGEGGGERADPLRHRQAVLEQAVPVGLVVVLAAGGLVVDATAVAGGIDQAAQQLTQVRALDGLHERVEVGGHLAVGDRRSPGGRPGRTRRRPRRAGGGR